MRKRSSNLLLNFLQPSRAISANKIAETYQISLRTLKSDLTEINDFLTNINEPLFNINELGNIQNDATINISHTKEKLYALNNYTYRCSQTERQLLIFAMLINGNDYITMESLAEKLFVSRITVLSDIELIKETLVNYPDITLVSKSSKGIKLEEKNELSLRFLLIDILRNIIVKIDDENVFLHILERELAVQVPIMQVALLFRKCEYNHRVLFSDDSFHEVILYLYVTLYRYKQGYYLSNQIPPLLTHNINHHYEMALIIKSELAALNIAMNEQEFALVINNIDTSQLVVGSQLIEDVELYKIVVYFLSKITIKFDVNLENDQLLIDSLVMHIKNQFDDICVDFDFSWEDEFQEQYWEILDDIEMYSVILERYLQRSLSEKMKLSIFIHICAAIIRAKKYQSPSLTVFVVCPGSMATGRFVEAQLNNYFNFSVAGVVARDRLLDLIKDNHSVDFIVSTVDVKTDLCPAIIVEPILTNSHFNQIQNLAFEINKKRGNTSIIKMNPLKSVIDTFEQLDQKNQSKFIADIKKVTTQYTDLITHKANINIVQMLGDSSNIQVTNKRIDWYEAIQIAGNILLDKQCITSQYIDEMVNKIRQYGPYVKVSPKIAIAHAKPEQFVVGEGLSLCISKQGIYFGDDEDNTINLMFCFSTMGHLEYIDLFWQIAHLSNDDIFIERLLNADTPHEAYQLIATI